MTALRYPMKCLISAQLAIVLSMPSIAGSRDSRVVFGGLAHEAFGQVDFSLGTCSGARTLEIHKLGESKRDGVRIAPVTGAMLTWSIRWKVLKGGDPSSRDLSVRLAAELRREDEVQPGLFSISITERQHKLLIGAVFDGPEAGANECMVFKVYKGESEVASTQCAGIEPNVQEHDKMLEVLGTQGDDHSPVIVWPAVLDLVAANMVDKPTYALKWNDQVSIILPGGLRTIGDSIRLIAKQRSEFYSISVVTMSTSGIESLEVLSEEALLEE